MAILKSLSLTILLVIFFVKISIGATGCLVNNALYTTTAVLGYKGSGQTSACGFTLSAVGRFDCYLYGGNTYFGGEYNAFNYSGPYQGGNYTAITNCPLDEGVFILILGAAGIGFLSIRKRLFVS